MGEIENLVGVLREVDRAVSGDRPLQSAITGLVPDLGEPGGSVPGIDAALAALAQAPPPPESSYGRLLVMAALDKAISDRFGAQGSERHKAVAALRPLTRDGSRRQAEDLLALASERVEHEPDPRVMKRTLLASAFARQLLVVIETRTATVEGAGRATRGRVGATATLPGYGVDDVDELLDPSTWQHLSGGRITMRPHAEDDLEDDLEDRMDRVYYETFRITSRLELTPRLRVIRQPRMTTDGDRSVQWLEYRLAGTQSPGELVKLDQGSIVIRETGDGVRIATTKRVLLTPPFDAPSLAMQADALGYFDAFEDMVRVAVATPGG